MTTTNPEYRTLNGQPVSVRTKLAATWTSFMFFYVYVDILNFYTPGTIEDILDGRVFEFDISQTFSVSALFLMAVPIFMVTLSTLLPARATRITNLIVVALYFPVTVFNILGASWVLFYGLGIAFELLLLALVVRLVLTWPRTSGR